MQVICLWHIFLNLIFKLGQREKFRVYILNFVLFILVSNVLFARKTCFTGWLRNFVFFFFLRYVM
jgi:hypothetical protein